MKPPSENKGSRAARGLLFVALICFGFDLYHFAHHLGHDPALLDLEGVRLKMAWKTGLFVGTFGLLIFSRWPRMTVMGIGMLGIMGSFAPGGIAGDGCERAREMMEKSGMARDAKEDFFGALKITPPRSEFPSEMDKVTWWGTFKPFEFWESPPFEATWINPRGEPVNRSSFRGGSCQLAKTTLSMNQLPQGRLEPGMWRVIISCGEVTIDNHPFPVVGSSPATVDSGTSPGSGVMIWADGIKD